jgi:hypothetical protein
MCCVIPAETKKRLDSRVVQGSLLDEEMFERRDRWVWDSRAGGFPSAMHIVYIF